MIYKPSEPHLLVGTQPWENLASTLTVVCNDGKQISTCAPTLGI